MLLLKYLILVKWALYLSDKFAGEPNPIIGAWNNIGGENNLIAKNQIPSSCNQSAGRAMNYADMLK